MTVEMRYITEAEFPDYVRAMFWATGRPVDDAFVAERRRCTDLGGAFATFEDGQLVGTIGMRKLTLRLPGGAFLPVAAIGQGGVLPAHGGRGHSRRMIFRLFEDARKAGYAVAVGTMAEWPGFGRYGWGPATHAHSWEIETRRTRFRDAAPPPGRCELVDAATAKALLPVLHGQASRAGFVVVPRDEAYWSMIVDRLVRGDSLDFTDVAGGLPAPFFCVHRDPGGVATGIAVYRILPRFVRGLSRSSLDLLYFVPTSADAHLGLWTQLLSLPHVEKIVAAHVPVDDPLPWLLFDARRVEKTGIHDHVWVRILDVLGALRVRGSGSLERPLTLRIDDPHLAETTVCKVTPAEGRLLVEPSDAAWDVQLEIGALGALYLGGTPVSGLLASKRIVGRCDRTLRELSSLFACAEQPFVDSEF